MNLFNKTKNINSVSGKSLYHEYIRMIIERFLEECVYEPENILKIRLRTSGAKYDDPGLFFRVINLYIEEDSSVRVDLSGLSDENSDLYGFRLAKLNESEQRKIFVRLASEVYLLKKQLDDAEDRQFLRELIAGV